MGNTKLGYGFLSQVFLGLRMGGGDILCRLNLEERRHWHGPIPSHGGA